MLFCTAAKNYTLYSCELYNYLGNRAYYSVILRPCVYKTGIPVKEKNVVFENYQLHEDLKT